MKIGAGTKVYPLSNLYGCTIGDHCTIANFVEIGKNVIIGDYCSIQAFAFIPEGVLIGDNVFIGPHVCFINCRYPSANSKKFENIKKLCGDSRVFKLEKTIVEDDVMIGAGSIIMCGVTIEKGSIIGAGSLILKDVPAHTTITQERKTIVNFR